MVVDVVDMLREMVFFWCVVVGFGDDVKYSRINNYNNYF